MDLPHWQCLSVNLLYDNQMKIPEISIKTLPRHRIEGALLGNGELGVVCWGDGRRLKFTLDSAAAWDLRHECHPERWPYRQLRELVEKKDFETIREMQAAGGKTGLAPRKLFLGRFELNDEFEAGCNLRLSLDNGIFSGMLRGLGGDEHTLTAFVARTDDLFCLRLSPRPAKSALTFRPFYETTPQLAELGHPEAQRTREGGLELVIQHILPDQFYCMCWNPTGPDIIVAVGRGSSAEDARRRALDKHAAAAGVGFDGLYAAHVTAWRAFWSSSGVALPERDMEFLWYLGIYYLASAARQGSLPPGIRGVWNNDGNACPFRGGCWGNINIQEAFWPAAPSGHLELLDVWLDHIHAALPAAEDFTRKVFGTGGAFFHTAFLPHYTHFSKSFWSTVGLEWSSTAFLAQLAWERWRYSMNVNWLRARGYPIVKSAFEFYSENLEMEADGHYHIPLSSSPEYLEGNPEAWAKDPNVDIALIRRCCDWMVEMEQALGISELTLRAREIHDKLVPYHLVEYGPPLSGNAQPSRGPYVLAVWKDRPLDRSHRHPSHLMAIHPAMDITIEGTETDRKIIDFSLLHYLSLGEYFWHGHTYAQMISLAAMVGRADMARNYVCRFRDTYLLPNAVYAFTGGYQGGTFFAAPSIHDKQADPRDVLHWHPLQGMGFDATGGVSRGLSDMLVQGWNDIIRVFPATPLRWADALFIDLLTEGAFRVSALKREGTVRWVRIRASVERLCRLRNPFADQPFQVGGADPRRDGDLLVWPMKAGQSVTLFTSGYARPDLDREQAHIRAMNMTTLNTAR